MLYKTLFVLTIVAALAVLIYGNAGPGMPFNPTPPVFNSPFVVSQTSTDDWFPTSTNWTNSSTSVTLPRPNSTYGNDHSCSYTKYWNCVNDPNGPDINTSITRNFGNLNMPIFSHSAAIVFNVSYTRPLRYVTDLTLEIRCYTPYPETPFPIAAEVMSYAPAFVNNYALSSQNGFKCPNPQNSKFPVVLYRLIIPSGVIDLDNLPNIFNGQFYFIIVLAKFSNNGCPLDTSPNLSECSGSNPIFYPDHIVNITSVSLHAVYSNVNNTTCATGDFWCQFTAFGNAILTGIIFFVNGVIWFFTWIGIMIQMLVNFISVVVWLYSVPGLPTIIQTFVSGVVTVWLAVIGIEMFKIIKPFS